MILNESQTIWLFFNHILRNVPMIFLIILLISFIIFRLLYKKPDDDFHRIVETCCLKND